MAKPVTASNYATGTTYSSPYGALPPAGGSANLAAYSAGSTPAWQTATPQPQGGQGPYGAVPGATPIPPSTYQQAGGVLPQLPALTAKTGQDVMNELNGVLSPETINNIQTHAAQFGVTSGMPGSGLAGHQGLESLGLSTEAVQQQGQQGYGSLLGSLAGTQLSPALISQVQGQNAELPAAPDPRAAAQQLQQNYLNASKGYGGTSITPPAVGGGSSGLNFMNSPDAGSTAILGSTQTGTDSYDPSKAYADWLAQYGNLPGSTNAPNTGYSYSGTVAGEDPYMEMQPAD